jgi:hypothetical protein
MKHDCYACANFSLCFLRRKLEAVIREGSSCTLLEPDALRQMYDLMGKLCSQFVQSEESKK